MEKPIEYRNDEMKEKPIEYRNDEMKEKPIEYRNDDIKEDNIDVKSLEGRLRLLKLKRDMTTAKERGGFIERAEIGFKSSSLFNPEERIVLAYVLDVIGESIQFVEEEEVRAAEERLGEKPLHPYNYGLCKQNYVPLGFISNYRTL